MHHFRVPQFLWDVFEMGTKNILLCGYMVICTFLMTNCANNLAQNYFRTSTPTTYTNNIDDEIMISRDGIMIDGKFYKGKDCSNIDFNCVVYGQFAAFITPRECNYTDGDIWAVDDIKAEVQGFEWHTLSDLVMTSFNDHLAYWFSKRPGEGILGIGYDKSGKIHIRIESKGRFYADTPPEEADRLLYYEPKGPSFMPCE